MKEDIVPTRNPTRRPNAEDTRSSGGVRFYQGRLTFIVPSLGDRALLHAGEGEGDGHHDEEHTGAVAHLTADIARPPRSDSKPTMPNKIFVDR